MSELNELIRNADWKSEKHVPVVECPDQVKSAEYFAVKVSMGKAVPHPNTTEHHIRWIQLYFLPDGAKTPFQIGNFDFAAHGESVDGPNKGPVYVNHETTASFRTTVSGTILALSYCNIHGVWQSSKTIKVA